MPINKRSTTIFPAALLAEKDVSFLSNILKNTDLGSLSKC